jgi:hypothetical protein
MKSKKNQRSSRKTKKNLSKSSKKYNLVYMAKPPYGGWVSFTAHLSKKFDYDLYKIGNKTENKKRPYGYDVEYQNVDINTLLKKPNLLITAIDKKYYEYLPKIKKATIVIHDPTELKEPVLEVLKRFKVITIRETVSKLLKEKYNVNNTFLHHPFYEFYPKKIIAPKTKALALSRVDFDKHTDMIIEANNLNKSGMNVEIYGALNDLYVYHKLRHTNFKKYYKGKFPKEFTALVELLEPCKFLVDMSAIKGDGGGSQYTFLEAIHMNCALVLNKKWVANVKTPFKHGVNCFIVETPEELAEILKRNPNTKNIVRNAKKMLLPHILGKGW